MECYLTSNTMTLSARNRFCPFLLLFRYLRTDHCALNPFTECSTQTHCSLYDCSPVCESNFNKAAKSCLTIISWRFNCLEFSFYKSFILIYFPIYTYIYVCEFCSVYDVRIFALFVLFLYDCKCDCLMLKCWKNKIIMVWLFSLPCVTERT